MGGASGLYPSLYPSGPIRTVGASVGILVMVGTFPMMVGCRNCRVFDADLSLPLFLLPKMMPTAAAAPANSNINAIMIHIRFRFGSSSSLLLFLSTDLSLAVLDVVDIDNVSASQTPRYLATKRNNNRNGRSMMGVISIFRSFGIARRTAVNFVSGTRSATKKWSISGRCHSCAGWFTVGVSCDMIST